MSFRKRDCDLTSAREVVETLAGVKLREFLETEKRHYTTSAMQTTGCASGILGTFMTVTI